MDKIKTYEMDVGISRKQLCQITGAPYYMIDYLRALNRLPLVSDTRETGTPTIFHPDAVEVVRAHMSKRSPSE